MILPTTFLRATRRDPARPALQDAAGTVSRQELASGAEQLADRLRAAALSGALVGVLLERDRHLATALLACCVADVAYLPLDPLLPAARVDAIVTAAGPSCVVTCERLRPLVPHGVPVLSVDRLDTAPAGPLPDTADAASLAYVMYTSGTTGHPKGVAVRRAGLANFFSALDRDLGPATGHMWFPVSGVGFDSSVAELLWPLTRGAYVCLSPNDPLALLESALVRGRHDGRPVTHVQCTPSHARMLASDPATLGGLRRLRTLLIGGEPFPEELVDDLRHGDAGPRLLNVYGPTETTVWVARAQVDADSTRPVPIGNPIPGAVLDLLGPGLRPVPAGTVGEIHVSGRPVAAGYWRRPDLTAESFLPHPRRPGFMYRTGDFAVASPRGDVHIHGRRDGQAKVRGHRVELDEVATAVRGLPAVRDAVCLVDARDNPDGDLIAVVVADRPVPVAEIRRGLAARLPGYMLPARTVRVPALPLTRSGKVDRAALHTTLGLPVRAAPADDYDAERYLLIASPGGRFAHWPEQAPVPPPWTVVAGAAAREDCRRRVLDALAARA